jgi:hypothetical protein
MKRYLLTITLVVMLCGTASAQSEFMNGYIIKNDGSYTYGQLKIISKGYSVKECLFRWFDISTEYIFLPGDIEAFGFTHGMRFKSVNDRGRKIFMACLTDGDLDLLYDGSMLYLDGMGLDMTPLGGNAGSINADGKIVSYSGYRDLIEKLPDPDNKFSVPSDISLNPEKMAEVIASYNNSRGVRAPVFALNNPSGVYEEMRNLGAFMSNYGVLAGINASRYDAEKINFNHLGFVPEMDFYEITPLFGIWYNRPLSRSKDRFTIQGELIAFTTNVYMYNETASYSTTTRSDINLSYTGIKVPLFFKVSFLEGSVKPFFSAGGFGMINLGAKYTREGETENAVHVVRPFTDNTILLNKSMFGGLAGVGVKKEFSPKKSFTVEFRAEYGLGIYNIDGIEQQTVIFNIIAGFDFF